MRFFLIILISGMAIHAFSQEFQCGDTFKDNRDGRVYPTVQIGEQCWMAANLNLGRQVEDHNQSNNGRIEKTCWGNDASNCEIFGGLYTWDEAMNWNPDNPQGICPDGWYIPGKEDWENLIGFLGKDSAGYHMKVKPDHSPSWDGSNSSGFTALPGGGGYEAYFHRKNSWALFWSSTENGEDRAWFAQLDNFWYPEPPRYHSLILDNYYQKFNGMSVRCIRKADL